MFLVIVFLPRIIITFPIRDVHLCFDQFPHSLCSTHNSRTSWIFCQFFVIVQGSKLTFQGLASASKSRIVSTVTFRHPIPVIRANWKKLFYDVEEAVYFSNGESTAL